MARKIEAYISKIKEKPRKQKETTKGTEEKATRKLEIETLISY